MPACARRRRLGQRGEHGGLDAGVRGDRGKPAVHAPRSSPCRRGRRRRSSRSESPRPIEKRARRARSRGRSTTLPSSSGDRTSRQCSNRTISSGRVTIPSATSQPGGELEVVPRSAHRDRERLGSDADLQRLLDGDTILARLERRPRRCGRSVSRRDRFAPVLHERRIRPCGSPRAGSLRPGRIRILQRARQPVRISRSGVHENRGSSAGPGGIRSKPMSDQGDGRRAHRKARPLRGLERARQRGDGGGLPRQGPRHRPAGRHQDHQDLADGGRRFGVPRVPRAVRPRGADRRNPVPPEHRHDPRHRRGHRKPRLLHRDGVHRGAQPEVAPHREEQVHLGRDRGPGRPDRRGARLRAPQGDHPPRHQARQHHPDDRRQGEDHRLRDRQDRLFQPDDHRAVPRHAQLHVAGAGLRRPGRRPERHLLARRRAVRAADEPQALSGRQPHGDLLQDRPRGLHAAGRALDRRSAGVQPDRGAGDGQGPLEPLSARQGPGPRALPAQGAPGGAESASRSRHDGVGRREHADPETRESAGPRGAGGASRLDPGPSADAARLPPSGTPAFDDSFNDHEATTVAPDLAAAMESELPEAFEEDAAARPASAALPARRFPLRRLSRRTGRRSPRPRSIRGISGSFRRPLWAS